jgi:PIN domain nuclease of toxin-antitoxin system
VNLLLDTHTLLWFLNDAPQLVPTATSLIVDPANRKFVSMATCWEIAIKVRLGKVSADPDEVVLAIEASGFHELPVRATHAAAVSRLELRHSDPFDRLLVAQAMTEPLRLLTADAALAPYSELVVVV